MTYAESIHRLPGETDKQFTLRVYEEKLAAIKSERRKLEAELREVERAESYWERAFAFQKLEEEAA